MDKRLVILRIHNFVNRPSVNIVIFIILAIYAVISYNHKLYPEMVTFILASLTFSFHAFCKILIVLVNNGKLKP